MALIYPYEDQTQTSGKVRFTPCTLGGKTLDTAEIIELYLPPSITFSDGASYEGFEMGVTGAIAIDAANASDNEINGNTFDAAQSQVEQLSGGNRVASALLAKLAGGIGPKQTIEGGLRAAVNPNTRVLFKSVALRTFQFSFKMLATSAREAREIERIVLSFRSQMYPTLAGGSDVTSIGYEYPDMYLIEMILGNREVPPKVKPSFLTSVTTNFNASSGALLAEDGNPEWSEVDIALTFGEGVTLSKKDIVEGF